LQNWVIANEFDPKAMKLMQLIPIRLAAYQAHPCALGSANAMRSLRRWRSANAAAPTVANSARVAWVCGWMSRRGGLIL
jgi:hypothetical protein